MSQPGQGLCNILFPPGVTEMRFSTLQDAQDFVYDQPLIDPTHSNRIGFGYSPAPGAGWRITISTSWWSE